MKTNLKKPPAWFWAVSILALLWNLMGASAYLTEAFMGPEDFEKLSQEVRSLYDSRPAWFTAAFATAVWAGVIGCIALLMRKKWAKLALIISLLGVIVQDLYMFFMSDTFDVMGSSAMALPLLVLVIAIFLVWFAQSATKKGYLA